MIKLLIFAVVAYLFYRAMKNILGIGHGSAGRHMFSKPPEQIDDLMVKDPYCEVYFPRKEGHHLRMGGEDLYFCSPECREKYEQENHRRS